MFYLLKNPNWIATKFCLWPHSVFLVYELHSDIDVAQLLMSPHRGDGLCDAAVTVRNDKCAEMALEFEHQD